MRKITLSINAYGQTVSVSQPEEASVPQMARAFYSAMLAAGYLKDSLDELFADGDPTVWDDSWPKENYERNK